MVEVIGAGFGRTGTHSLSLALERLGLGPCYNLLEVTKNAEHADIWMQAMDGKPVNWDCIFDGYKSTVEWPGVTFFYELAQHFPTAKVILTLRDPMSWYESASKTIFEGLELSAHNPDPIKRASSSMKRRLILEHTFGGRYWDKEHVIEIYEKHIQQVIERIPNELLLQFDVKDGWEPLCEFLQKPIPLEPFPWLNERNEFMASEPEWAKKIKDEKRHLTQQSFQQETDMHLEFKRLSDINISDIIAVNTNPLVLRQMPLSGDNWEESEWMEWVEGKEKQWEEYGYGPWAFIIDGKFAGWGGFQYENGDADLGLVLHPDFWGTGRIIYDEIINRAFGEMGFESIIILFPPTRTRIKGILRLGFQLDGEVELYGEKFIRYRLFAPKKVLS